jgi:hypothetical protein
MEYCILIQFNKQQAKLAGLILFVSACLSFNMLVTTSSASAAVLLKNGIANTAVTAFSKSRSVSLLSDTRISSSADYGSAYDDEGDDDEEDDEDE